MDAKTWLLQMYDLERYIRCQELEKQRVEEIRCSLPSLAPNDVRSPGNSSGNARYVDIIARTEKEMDKICARLAAAKEEQDQLRAAIISATDELKDPFECLVIRYKYCDFLTDEEISSKIDYSDRHVRRIHKRALTHIKPTK